MDRARWQIQAIADAEIDGLVASGQPETDRAALDGDDLVVRVVVCRVSLARTVPPAVRPKTLIAHPSAHVPWHGYVAVATPIAEPMR
jgi:hypothetical protein